MLTRGSCFHGHQDIIHSDEEMLQPLQKKVIDLKRTFCLLYVCAVITHPVL